MLSYNMFVLSCILHCGSSIFSVSYYLLYILYSIPSILYDVSFLYTTYRLYCGLYLASRFIYYRWRMLYPTSCFVYHKSEILYHIPGIPFVYHISRILYLRLCNKPHALPPFPRQAVLPAPEQDYLRHGPARAGQRDLRSRSQSGSCDVQVDLQQHIRTPPDLRLGCHVACE